MYLNEINNIKMLVYHEKYGLYMFVQVYINVHTYLCIQYKVYVCVNVDVGLS